MYSTAYAQELRPEPLFKVISRHPFATIVFNGEAIHLPLIRQENLLIGHMAIYNPAWEQMHEQEVLAIFHGPEGYINPDWYESDEKLPTWNYVTVHVRGKLTVYKDPESVKEALLILGHHQQPEYDLEKHIDENSKLLSQIVSFKIVIGSMEGKFKLAQSKSVTERKNVIRHLRQNPSPFDLAESMESTLVKI